MELNATFWIQMALLLLLMAILGPVLFAPFLALFDLREEKIVGAAKSAQYLTGDADKVFASIDEKTQAAQKDGQALYNALKAEAEKKERAIVEEAKQLAALKLAEAQKNLSLELTQVKATLPQEAEKIASEIVQKILGRTA